MNRLSMLALLGTLLISLSTCGKKDDKDKNDNAAHADLTKSPFEQIATDWSGFYRQIDNGKATGDATGASAKFKVDSTFSIVMSNDTTAKVEGKWSEFQGKTLLLTIVGSTIPRIGVAGKMIEASYDLAGSSLRIYSDTFDLKLTKKVDLSLGGGSTGSPGLATGRAFYSGSWNCDDAGGRSTRLIINSDDSFKLSSLKDKDRLFVTQGKVTLESTSVLKLKPESSSDEVPRGSFFSMRPSQNQADLDFVPSSGPLQRMGSCTK